MVEHVRPKHLDSDDDERFPPYTHSRHPDYKAPVNYLFEVGKLLSLHPDKWRQVLLRPESNLVEWFVGKVMKETDGRADYNTVKTIYKALADIKAW